MTTPENYVLENPFASSDHFRRTAFRRIPGVVNRSEHLFRTGKRRDYYLDIDPLLDDPVECRKVVRYYIDMINSILTQRQINVLGFIEKDRDSGGTTGVIRLAAAISIETGIPNLTIRLGKELPEERIKLRALPKGTPVQASLEGLAFAVLSDHSTTGSEALRANEAVRYRGGRVTDFIVYSLIKPEFQFNAFKEQGIKVHPYFIAPDGLVSLGFEVKQEQGVSDPLNQQSIPE